MSRPYLHARVEVVAAMARRGVHDAGALLERHVIGQHAERVTLVERVRETQALEQGAPEQSPAAPQ
jgi:hypothetical protein